MVLPVLPRDELWVLLHWVKTRAIYPAISVKKGRLERLVPLRGSTELVLPVLPLRRSVDLSTGGRTRATHPASALTFHL